MNGPLNNNLEPVTFLTCHVLRDSRHEQWLTMVCSGIRPSSQPWGLRLLSLETPSDPVDNLYGSRSDVVENLQGHVGASWVMTRNLAFSANLAMSQKHQTQITAVIFVRLRAAPGAGLADKNVVETIFLCLRLHRRHNGIKINQTRLRGWRRALRRVQPPSRWPAEVRLNADLPWMELSPMITKPGRLCVHLIGRSQWRWKLIREKCEGKKITKFWFLFFFKLKT